MMTTFNSLNLIFCLNVVLLMISVSTSHSRTFHLNDEKLIENTCKKTPNYNVCIQSLKSNPRSFGADVGGLALIMVDVMKAKANEAVSKIRQLQRSGSKPGLTSCVESYDAILDDDIPEAIFGIQAGMPKFAEQAANDAVIEANSCQDDFPGPLTIQNKAMSDVASVTSAIVKLLL
ncbi:hypothetical protein RIF29_41974 [Crotalaria pallida]|uniref:Pectinesterase inhibitor domain-containing protein n=1 Tax=Crotalaria pallida TaxID=3830 RepID=A0AAN9HT81_CROPI